MRLTAILLTVGIARAQISIGVPSRRYLVDTPWGQLHYVTSRSFNEKQPTLALFHSNPHSHLEFREFLVQDFVKHSFNFAAFDYFGNGGSDDCNPPACGENPFDGDHPYVTVEEFVQASLHALRSHVTESNIACIGHLKGASAAIECARQLGARADVMMSINPLYFLPPAVVLVKNYTNHTLHVTPVTSGRHLLDAWFQPSAAPCDYVNATYCKALLPSTLAQNELKTLDRIRAFRSQWQYIMAGLGYNGQLINRTCIRSISAKKYIGWGTTAMSMWKTDGFSAGLGIVNEAWSEATRNGTRIDFVERGSEGSMVQNASYYAAMLKSLYAGHQ